MSIDMPWPLPGYFASDAAFDAEAVSECFAEHATVEDDGGTYVGREAIRKWKTEADGKYSYTVKPLAIVDKGDEIVVTGRVSGSFPGSPVDLRYAFTVEDDLISAMTIAA